MLRVPCLNLYALIALDAHSALTCCGVIRMIPANSVVVYSLVALPLLLPVCFF